MLMVTSTGQTPKFRRDTESTGTYYQLSKEKVAYTVSLSDLVIADYDAIGAVRGLEFVGKQTEPLEQYLELARKAGRGAMGKTRGPRPGTAKNS